MRTSTRVLAARRLAVAVVLMTMTVMVLGAWVKANDAGLACPDWPQCYGEWLPPFPSAENNGTWGEHEVMQVNETGVLVPVMEPKPVPFDQARILYEWTHRLVASLLGLPFLAWVALTAPSKKLHVTYRTLPAVGLFLLAGQVALGAITVVGKNAPWLTTAHLANAVVLLVIVTIGAAWGYLHPVPGGREPELHRRMQNRAAVTVKEETGATYRVKARASSKPPAAKPKGKPPKKTDQDDQGDDR